MTLGCKVNYYETEKLTEKFAKNGFKIVPFDSVADIYIINTCTVTGIADRKSRKMLHRAARLNEKALIVAMGCFVDASEENVKKDENIHVLIGNEDKEKAFEIISSKIKEMGLSGNKEEDKIESEQTEEISEIHERTRAYIKIQDGCNQFCSYCKIPYVRGRLKSRDEADVIAEICELADKGYKEVVLTGIHLSSYGVDKSECKSFVELGGRPLYELLWNIAKVPGIERIRLSSLEPRIITEGFVKNISENKKVCPHFHLSLQSGCDKTLENMRRKYTTADYKKACELLRKYYKEPAITTDVIVGFPGENEEDYEISRKFVEDMAFSDIHVFKYSIREGTKAANFSGQVKNEDKDARSKKMIETGHMLTDNYISAMIGKQQLVLVEEKAVISGETYWLGHNERYVKCAFKCETDTDYENMIIEALPTKVIAVNTLQCEI